MAHGTVMFGTLAVALLFFGGASCSDDTEQPGVDAKVTVDSGQDVDAGLPDAAEADTTGTGDGPPPPPPCDEQTLGDPCTQGGSECGSTNECLITEGTNGFCSCGCLPDVAKTGVMVEDTCPGAGKTRACGLFPSPTSGKKEHYCFSLLTNTPQHPSCTGDTALMADPADPHFMVAARFTPPSYPFTVTSIRYLLPGSDTDSACENGLAHRAEVHAGANATPESNPTVAATFDVPRSTSSKDPLWALHGLDTPVKLQSGEHLYVLVEVMPDGAQSLCVQGCADNATGETSFIDVDSDQPPYEWKSFKEMKWDGDLTIAAMGF
jgi:hypothetical protein